MTTGHHTAMKSENGTEFGAMQKVSNDTKSNVASAMSRLTVQPKNKERQVTSEFRDSARTSTGTVPARNNVASVRSLNILLFLFRLRTMRSIFARSVTK